MSDFVKHDTGKVRLSLLPFKAILELGKVVTYGAKKYSANGWRAAKTPEDLARYEDALLRHFVAYMGGEENDPESGLPHLAHVMTNAAFLLELKLSEKATPNE